ncbi:VWA domain-containing protein, partial [Flavobacteriaceae bacterium]|nr:VWA domain-containing protein [Flavobacteriaceae bacterium]
MENYTNIFILIALLFSILIGYYQYYFKVIPRTNYSIFLFSIRSLVFFLLFLLLINPSIPKKDLIIEKPTLSVLVDNSLSIKYLNKDSIVNTILSNFKSSEILKKKFDVSYYSFGEHFNVINSLNFDEKQTDIYTPLSSISKNYSNANNGIILLSDGNQTIGKDYEFIKMNVPIFSIIVGDTLTYNDVSIDKINTNRYCFVNNKFPVESLLQYNGEESVRLKYTIENTGKIIYSKTINLNKENNSRLLNIEITSKNEGLNYYKATIENLDNEKNISNNTKEFSIEVINKQSKILIVSPHNHPDLGALKKAIESDKQRKVIIHTENIDDINLSSYKSIIIYQPNFSFKKIINKINKFKKPYLLITGSNTDWSFINSNFTGLNKNDINTVENYRPRLNKNFLIFNQNNIGFENFPPLLDKFGETSISIPHQTLLYQNIKGFNSKEPLLAISKNNNQKKVFLFGEGIWKWRSTSYLMTNSFENFDNFISNIV